MYSTLLNHLDSWPQIFKALKSFPNSICLNCDTVLIDNAELKKVLFGAGGPTIPDTLDGMFFPRTHTLLLIHMIKWVDSPTMGNQLSNSANLPAKINATIALLNRLIVRCDLDHNFRDFHANLAAHPVPVVILSDVPKSELAKFRLQFLPFLNLNQRSATIGEIKFMTCEEFGSTYVV